MALHNYCDAVSNAYIVAICNTPFISRYTESFVNFTINFQVNDCRIIPIIIPESKILFYINKLVYEIINLKQKDPCNSKDVEKKEQQIYSIINGLYKI